MALLTPLAPEEQSLQTELQLVAPEHSAARRVIDISGLSTMATVREDLG